MLSSDDENHNSRIELMEIFMFVVSK